MNENIILNKTLGIGPFKVRENGKLTKAYRTWDSMLRRCYGSLELLHRPTYETCTVDPTWLNFQTYALWFEQHYIEGYQLDKDLLIKGNKIYGPDTCCFIPREINMLLVTRVRKRGTLPLGVAKLRNKFQSSISKEGVRQNLGTFNTIEEAFFAYKDAKEFHLKVIAERFKAVISEKEYLALFNYKVTIVD